MVQGEIERPVASVLAAVTTALTFAMGACSGPPNEVPVPSPTASAGLRTELDSTHWVTQEEVLAHFAAGFGITDIPKVPVIREVTPEERGALLNECMADSGWVSDSERRWSYSVDQTNDFNLSLVICHAQYPLEEIYLQPLTESQLTFIRTYWETIEIPCLANLGYEISGPPEDTLFPSNHDSSPQWSPSGAIIELLDGKLDQGTMTEIFTQCPEIPLFSDIVQH
jgi:hypothetical protein